jgi:hypothetical protein
MSRLLLDAFLRFQERLATARPSEGARKLGLGYRLARAPRRAINAAGRSRPPEGCSMPTELRDRPSWATLLRLFVGVKVARFRLRFFRLLSWLPRW